MALDTLRSREHNVALLERYGTLLTEHQRDVLELHLGSDWSLAEIATRQRVSRSAVHDLIRRSVQLLEDSERRLGLLADSLEVISRMLGPGHATFVGEHASASDAINLPKGLQTPRVPIMVGGNGPEVTWRLAARYADELNLDNVGPEDVPAMLPVIRSRCEEVGRDPASLRVSCLTQRRRADTPGAARREQLASYRESGLDRVMLMLRSSVDHDDALEMLAEDALAAGAELAGSARLGCRG
jgi:predicted DNA-binding protein YlxM (UPF0122 family)